MTDGTILTNLARAQGEAMGAVYLWAERQPRSEGSLDYRMWARSNTNMVGFLQDLLMMERAIKNGFRF